MQSGYDINNLVEEALFRWLKPAEVYFILKNCDEHQLTQQIPKRPESGSLFIFNKRVLKYFRKDGHIWRRRRDQRTIAEAHEKLKVGNIEALNCYYAHGEENPNFQRRSYWILDPEYEHLVLVHYRDTREGVQSAFPASNMLLCSSVTTPTHNSAQHSESSFVNGNFPEYYDNELSPDSVEVSSYQVVRNHDLNVPRIRKIREEVNSLMMPGLNHALQGIKQQLSLNDEEVKEINKIYIENEDSNNLDDMLREYDLSAQTSYSSDTLVYQTHSGDEVSLWTDTIGNSERPDFESQARYGGQSVLMSSMALPQEVKSMQHPVYSPDVNANGTNSLFNPSLLHQDQSGVSVENSQILTIPKKKFTIREISPQWCYTSDLESTKIIVIGSFLCNPLEGAWACMFGDTEVPAQLIQDGVLCCHAPWHLDGKVSFCITSGNRVCCSEIREFEYRDNPSAGTYNFSPDNVAGRNSEQLLLLVRLTQILLSDIIYEGEIHEPNCKLSFKSRVEEDSWSQTIDALLVGSSESLSTLDWIVEELLKDKLEIWLLSRMQNKTHNNGCPLSKKEQGIIHIVSGLGFEWALQLILNSGVSVNFRDINGWTALHWAAQFGREKMVASLIASGASAGAVTDPTSQDPTGKTPASIAMLCGHKGLAGYLSEVMLTSYLNSLVLEESDLSRGSAEIEAERTVDSITIATSSANVDQVSLTSTLAAVRSAAQAAARIQSAFRTHSFRRRQHREAVITYSANKENDFRTLENDVQGLSAASKLAFRNAREYNSAALSIQKKYRSWKGRKDFLTIRQNVVKIQAHVRGHQVRKNYKVCWAVGILEKLVLRWRRRGVGLRGFRHELDYTEASEEDEDILKMFRKQKVDDAVDEAVSRVLSMFESPEARQQYQRILEKYSQAKAELGAVEMETSSPNPNFFDAEDTENYRFT